MKQIFLILLLSITSTANAVHLFENAVRRDNSSDREVRPIVMVKTRVGDASYNCTGFFVKNKHNLPYIATARHCANYQITEFCNAGAITVVTEFGKHQGKCKKMLAAVNSQDLAIFQADFENWEQVGRQVHFLQLSNQRPRNGTKLKMIGYPSDPLRKGKLTVTENCWVHDGRMVVESDYSAQARASKQQAMSRISSSQSAEEIRRAEQIKYDRVAFHNCSVYGGNSGGPILIHGTGIVLGLPTAYYPGTVEKRSPKLSTSMDSTAIFLSENEEAIRQAGIEFVSPYKQGKYVAPYQWFKSASGNYYCYRTSDPAGSKPVDSRYCEDTADRIAR